MSETTGGASTYFLNDPNNPTGYTKAIEESSTQGGTPTRSYILGQKVEGQKDSTNGVLYLITDGHGSTRALADTVGGVASPDKYDYTAFGDAIGFTASSAKTKWLFGGDGVYDPASGFTYHLARWRSGFRFTSRDSYPGDSEDPISLHKYVYASVNPIFFSDRSGHFSTIEEEGTSAIQSSLAGMEGGSFQNIFNSVGRLISGISAEQAVVGLLADTAFQVVSLVSLNLISGAVEALRDGSFAARWGSWNAVKEEAAAAGFEGTSAANRYMFQEYKKELAGAQIAGGHAFDKHVIKEGQFIGIATREEFATEISNIMKNPTDVRYLTKDRVAYWDDANQIVVIYDPSTPDGGTAFKPRDGAKYFYETLK